MDNEFLDWVKGKTKASEKHLQGAHNQATHGRRGGAAGGSEVSSAPKKAPAGGQPKAAAKPASGGEVELSDWDKSVIKASEAAKVKGIKTFSGNKAQDFSREAAGVINSHRKTGYTVHSSGGLHDLDKKGQSTGQFPVVGYGAGESKRAVSKMRSLLEDFGYTTSLGPQDYGIIVGHPSWKE